MKKNNKKLIFTTIIILLIVIFLGVFIYKKYTKKDYSKFIEIEGKELLVFNTYEEAIKDIGVVTKSEEEAKCFIRSLYYMNLDLDINNLTEEDYKYLIDVALYRLGNREACYKKEIIEKVINKIFGIDIEINNRKYFDEKGYICKTESLTATDYDELLDYQVNTINNGNTLIIEEEFTFNNKIEKVESKLEKVEDKYILISYNKEK